MIEDIENYIIDSAHTITNSTSLSKKISDSIDAIINCFKNGKMLQQTGETGFI